MRNHSSDERGLDPRQTALAVGLFVATAAYYILVTLHAPTVQVAFDIYGHFLPMKIYAAQSVFDGGKGLLWTPFQSCGQPFFANPATSLLYPPHLLFLVLDANVAVHIVLAFNMAMGALGAFLLLRQMGLQGIAALGGALAFELGDPMAELTGWGPMQSGSWTWVPWALLMCERVLQAPSRTRIIQLAVTLSLVLLPGWILITALTYQVIALRIAWEICTRRDVGSLRAAAAVVVALILMPLLVAVQLIPAVEFSRQTFRVGTEVEEFVKFGGMPLAGMVRNFMKRRPPVPFMAVLLPLAAAAALALRQRRLVWFWLLTGAAFVPLALGPATPLYGLYAHLPPGPALIRYAHRLFWVTGLSLALLAAFGVDALADRQRPLHRSWILLGVVATIATAVYGFAPGGLRPVEGVVLGILILACAAALAPQWRATAAWVAVAAIALNVVAVPVHYGSHFLDSIDAYRRFEPSLAEVRTWETAQDRTSFYPSVGTLMGLTLMHKTASLVRVKEIYDYDALIVQRQALYNTMLNLGEVPRSIDTVPQQNAKPRIRQRLLNVAAVRYVVTVASTRPTVKGLMLRPLPLSQGGIELYANDTALNRARVVPRIEVIQDSDALLHRLAYGTDDLTTVALVDTPVPSGFEGRLGSIAGGSAVFVLDDPEHLIIDVDAPTRGFLVVADQYYPGWRATVNGTPAPIVQANYTFRLIEVPAGRSRVEFRYRPASVAVGALISLVAFAAVGAILWHDRRRR